MFITFHEICFFKLLEKTMKVFEKYVYKARSFDKAFSNDIFWIKLMFYSFPFIMGLEL